MNEEQLGDSVTCRLVDLKIMNDIIKIICSEFKVIGSNIPILIVLILGNVGYGFLYNLMYNTNVYREAPIAVVDMSQSDVSRHFIDYIDATQQVDIFMKTQDFHHAKQKLIEREIIVSINNVFLSLEFNIFSPPIQP